MESGHQKHLSASLPELPSEPPDITSTPRWENMVNNGFTPSEATVALGGDWPAVLASQPLAATSAPQASDGSRGRTRLERSGRANLQDIVDEERSKGTGGGTIPDSLRTERDELFGRVNRERAVRRGLRRGATVGQVAIWGRGRQS